MTVEHRVIDDSQLHEPKGAAGASVGEVYVSDGAGSGNWQEPEADTVQIDDSGGFYTSTDVEGALQELGYSYSYGNGVIDDVSTAGFVLIPIPEDATVQRVRTVLQNAITVADATVTVSRGGDAAVLGNIIVGFSGSAEGDVDENESLSNNTVTRSTHQYIKVATDGGSTTAAKLWVEVKFRI